MQIVVLNHINLFGYINPMVYIAWVFLFPFKKNKFSLLISSFLLGLTIDFFSDSGGINAAATLFIAYFRIPILKIICQKSDIDSPFFKLNNIATYKIFLLIFSLTMVHHFIVFSLEYFKLSDLDSIIYNTFITGIFSIFLSILGIILFTSKNK